MVTVSVAASVTVTVTLTVTGTVTVTVTDMSLKGRLKAGECFNCECQHPRDLTDTQVCKINSVGKFIIQSKIPPMSKNSPPDLALEVLGLFRIIFKSASKHFEEIEKSVGVSGAQLWALSEIANADGITVSGLAKAMSLHQSTTSNLVEKLESRGLAKRIRSTEDRRVVVLQATKAGKTALAQAPGPFRGILPDALMRMGGGELKALKQNLDALIVLLERKSENAAREPLGTPIKLKN